MKVEALMVPEVKTCKPDDDLSVPAGWMWNGDFGCVPVVDGDGRVLGVITDRDICMAAYTQGRLLHDIPVFAAMSKKVHTCLAHDDVREAEDVMRRHQVRRLPVLNEEGRMVGLISLNDVAREASNERLLRETEVTPAEVARTLAAVCEHVPRGERRVVFEPKAPPQLSRSHVVTS